MKVKDWMSSKLITVTPETGVSAAWDLMRARRVRHLLVVRTFGLLGILSDRDIRLALPSPATTLSAWEINFLLSKLRVETIMTRTPVTIPSDRSVSEAAAIMIERRIGALPVVDGETVRGIITQTDVLRAFTSAPEAVPEIKPPARPPKATPTPLKTLLLPVDRTGEHKQVLEAARVLARRSLACLRLLHVAPSPAAVINSEGKTVSYADQEAARVEGEVLRDLRAVAAGVVGVPVECVVRFGDPVREILSEAESADVDLIVMASHRRSGVRRFLKGSVAEEVERATTRPVLLLPWEEDEAGVEAALATAPVV